MNLVVAHLQITKTTTKMASHTTTVQLQTPIDSRYNRIRHLVKFTNSVYERALPHRFTGPATPVQSSS